MRQGLSQPSKGCRCMSITSHPSIHSWLFFIVSFVAFTNISGAYSSSKSSSSSTLSARDTYTQAHHYKDFDPRNRGMSRAQGFRGQHDVSVHGTETLGQTDQGATSSSNLPRKKARRLRGSSTSSSRSQQRGGGGRSRSPNVVVILTDDQDVLLGSLRYMPKVQRLLMRQGTVMNNSFVSTPMCCPSRSTFLTGMYVHNHNTYTNNANCSSPSWQKNYESRAFPTYVNSTYRTGYFGKYLNDYFGDHTPPGWHRWMGLIRNSRFYNYSLVDEKGRLEYHGDNYYNDYLTDLIAHRGTAWFKESKLAHPSDPIMMVLSVPAPHGPEDAAPQYQHMFVNNTDHRTPAWNYAPNPDKQWLLQYKSPLTPQFKLFTDMLQRKRLQTLQSVDDMVELVVSELDQLGELDNTYILYTSDHGYHLGQFGLVKGKAMPFDFDTRVPLIVRGPGVQKGLTLSNIVVNADMAPTFLDMAGYSTPDQMDGQSILRLLKGARDPNNVDAKGFVTTKKPWKDTVLLERGKLNEKVLLQRERTEEMIIFNQVERNKDVHFYIPTRRRKLAIECSKPGSRLPCKSHQKWYCIEVNGRLKKHKCKNQYRDQNSVLQHDEPETSRYRSCACPSRRSSETSRNNKASKRLKKMHRRRQRRLSKKFQRRDLKTRSRRKRSAKYKPSTTDYEKIYDPRCRILSNQSVVCDLDIYKKPREWATHKEKVDTMIKEYRKALDDLRDIRRHLREQRPLEDPFDGFGGRENKDDIKNKDFDEKDLECLCDDNGDVIDPRERKRGTPMPEGLSRTQRRKLRKTVKRKSSSKKRKRKKLCNTQNMNCFTHDNDHWKTPPYWTHGPFCFCSNANNNTYWCLRTINQTHDFLYCEFITTFISYYDMLTDPFQLKNTVTELNYGILQQLHETLEMMKSCSGRQECALRSNAIKRKKLPHRQEWPGLISIRRSKARHHRYTDKRSGLRKHRDENFNDLNKNFHRNGKKMGRRGQDRYSDWSLDYE